MPNQYVNKVEVNGTTIIDLTGDTVTAATLMQGYTAHDRSGALVTGTASGGGGGDSYTLTTILAQRTLNPDSQHWAEVPGSDWIEAPAVGEYYLVTFDGIEYLCTGGSMWDNEVVFGDDNNLFQNNSYMVPFAVDYSIPQQVGTIGCVDTNQHTIKIEHFEFVDGPLTIIPKSITANGTYNASSDNADGYSSVTVNVPSSGGTDFIVDFEYNSSTQMWEPDCTYAEIAQAVSDGKHIGGEIESSDSATVNCEWDDLNDKFYYQVIQMEDSTTGTWQIYSFYQENLEKTFDTSLKHPYGTKSITENGTNIDVTNYASVNVAVPSSGASNFVMGEFVADSGTGAAHTVNIPYTGTGYPIAAMVFIAGGAYESGTTWYESAQRYAVGQWTYSKSVQGTAPTWEAQGVANQGVTTWVYKNTSSASYSRSSVMSANVLTSSSKTATGTGAMCVRFNGNGGKTLSYYTASTSYGLLAGETYKYIIIYSS